MIVEIFVRTLCTLLHLHCFIGGSGLSTESVCGVETLRVIIQSLPHAMCTVGVVAWPGKVVMKCNPRETILFSMAILLCSVSTTEQTASYCLKV